MESVFDGLTLSPDWTAPWLAAYRDLDPRIAAPGSPPRFVPASDLPRGEAYESHVFRTGNVPVRATPHDFFHALVWRRFPRFKQQMNAQHAAELARRGRGGPRGPLRDALTLLDENGAVLHAPQALWDALVERAWQRLFVDLRPWWREARLTVVGHALLEQLEAAPRKPLTAHVLLGQAPAHDDRLDDWMTARVADGAALAAKPFTPLPVLGVPGWWAGNQNFSFYDDSTVFRPRRETSKPTSHGPSATGTA
jgi:hypothetical protein